MVGGCARKLRAFVRRQSDTIVTGTQNVMRRSSLADSADEENYVPKNLTDKIRHRVVRKLLKSKPKPKANIKEQPSNDEKRKFADGALKRIIMWRKSKQNAPSIGEVQSGETQKDAVAMNFDNSAENNSKFHEGSSCIQGGGDDVRNDSSSIIELTSNDTDNSLEINGGNPTEMHEIV